MLFWLVPSTRVRFPAAFVGAVVTTFLFTCVRWGFGVYADHLLNGQFNVIYGTVGLAIIFLIAIELMWVIILLGVEISYVWQNLYGVLRAAAKERGLKVGAGRDEIAAALVDADTVTPTMAAPVSAG
jgi:membrane protein